MGIEQQDLPFASIHHVNLLTRDLNATIRFYCGVLGMQLVVARHDKPGRHCFLDWGGW
ncbi:MAG: hypothetical protein NVS2B16_36730 [Chloroflexota bacterium]